MNEPELMVEKKSKEKGDESAARVLRYVSLVAIGAAVGGMIGGAISGLMSLVCVWLYPCINLIGLIGGDGLLVGLTIIFGFVGGGIVGLLGGFVHHILFLQRSEEAYDWGGFILIFLVFGGPGAVIAVFTWNLLVRLFQ